MSFDFFIRAPISFHKENPFMDELTKHDVELPYNGEEVSYFEERGQLVFGGPPRNEYSIFDIVGRVFEVTVEGHLLKVTFVLFDSEQHAGRAPKINLAKGAISAGAKIEVFSAVTSGRLVIWNAFIVE